ncbi:agmatine deiminase family protein [Phaeodactylibacter luteus]|nr:agmatine deiminase family protein [Phaeodactylibacter luteus]
MLPMRFLLLVLLAVSPLSTALPQAPPPPVRLMAEWEEAQALLVSWRNEHSALLREIVRYGQEECRVMIFADNPANVASFLEAGGVPLEQVDLLSPPYNSIWIRDYGPWTIYHNDVDSLMIADYIYNRPWRPQDDDIPAFVAQQLGLPFYEAAEAPNDWVHSGGNNLRDGMGTIFSSDLVLGENPGKSEAEIDAIAHLFFGADRYVKLPALPFDVIHHLDMHMRLIDEETIVIGQYPEGVADGPQIEANIEYLLNEVPTPFGNPYRIIRMPMPPDADGRYPDNNGDYRTYTNALFVNKTLLVPIYEEQYDTTALRIYEEALPGYRVVGIDCNGIIPSLGAIHCITKLVGANDPLWIAHARLRDQESSTAPYPISAIIKHKSGIAGAALHYREAGTENYTAVPLLLEDTLQSVWAGAIPPFPENTVLEYYLSAEAQNGKTQVRPMPAPEGYFRFRVNALQPAFSPGSAILCPGQSITFDNLTAGSYDSLRWEFPGGQPAQSTAESPTIFYNSSGTFPVRLIAYKGAVADTLDRSAAVEVRDLQLPYTEGFSSGLPATWEVDNPNADAAVWEVAPLQGCDPGAMRLNNFLVDTRGTSDFLRASFDLAGMNSPALKFDLAYAQKTSAFEDGLRVNVVDCEGNRVTVFEQFGAALATAEPQISPFAPADCSEWRTEQVDLSSFAGQGLAVEFENVGGYGNNLYLDLIQIVDQSPSRTAEHGQQFSARLFPNPARGQAQVRLENGPVPARLEWVLLNKLGQQAKRGEWLMDGPFAQFALPLQGLPAGMYTLQLRAGAEATALKLSVR